MSESYTARSILQPLLVALPVGVLSCLLTLWLVQPTSAPPLPATPINTDELVRKFDDLLSSRIDVGLRTDRGPAIERRLVPEDSALAGEMSGIIDRLEYLLSVVRTGGSGNQGPVQREVQINWGELDALKALGEANWETAEETVILLTPPEVVARFGFPSQVQTSEDYDMTWFYMRNELEGKPDATIQFRGGYVVSAIFF